MIIAMGQQQVEEVSQLAKKLWPHAVYEELTADFARLVDQEDEICYLLYEEERAIGFVHASTRYDYVEGTEKSPVAYVEGIYIEEAYRRKGNSGKLIKAVEKWAKERGYSELASDCELDNQESIDFHLASCFEEVNRVVCFVKKLGCDSSGKTEE